MKTQLSLFDTHKFLSLKNDIYVGRSLQLYGEWSQGEIELLKVLLPDGGNIIEVGSNIGAHSVFLARDLCKGGALYAFEPRRVLFQLLCANLSLNNVENAHCFRMALGERSEVLKEAAFDTEGFVNAGGFALNVMAGDEEIIRVTTIDKVLDTMPTIALLKADIEGYELNMLKGGEQLIERDRPFLYLENDKRNLSPLLLSHVMERGYEVWWHLVPLFRPNNLAGSNLNVFGNTVSANILCVPVEKVLDGLDVSLLADQHPTLRRCESPASFPFD